MKIGKSASTVSMPAVAAGWSTCGRSLFARAPAWQSLNASSGGGVVDRPFHHNDAFRVKTRSQCQQWRRGGRHYP